MEDKKVNDKKSSWCLCVIIAIVISAALLVIAGLFDMDISKAVADLKPGEYYSKNGFARAVEIFGEMPIYLFVAYALAVMFWNAFYFGKPSVKYSVCIVCLVLIAGVCYFVPYRIHSYYTELSEELIKDKNAVSFFKISVGICLGAIFLIGVMLTGKQNIRKQLSFAVIVLFVAAASQLVAQGIKLIDQRVRYRAICAMGDGGETYFTPWYKLNGKPESFKVLIDSFGKDSVKSFPSGHTTAAGIAFTLMALPYTFKTYNDKGGKIVFFAISFACVVLVAYARVLMGAHYFSDVVFGAIISYFLSVLALWLVYKKKALKPLNVYCGL